MKYILVGTLNPEWIGRQKQRVESVKAKARELGITIERLSYTQGIYDFVVHVEASDYYVMLAFSMWYAKQGYGRMTTMPAFDEAVMDAVVEKL